MDVTFTQKQNQDVWRQESIIDRYSRYNLESDEKYLFGKYFLPGSSVLDLACGLGRTTLRLYEMGYKVKGIDLSDMFINMAAKRFPYIPFEQGSFTEINENNESYDNILISYNSIDCAFPETEREKVLSECARVLRDKGHFVFSSHNIKSLQLFNLPFFYRNKNSRVLLLKNIFHFQEKVYITQLYHKEQLTLFYADSSYIIKQVEKHGFLFKEMIGVNPHFGKLKMTYFSPWINYVFKKK
jgi:ubiquinone/menaquinone biosynthesis C-methylase UbiE